MSESPTAVKAYKKWDVLDTTKLYMKKDKLVPAVRSRLRRKKATLTLAILGPEKEMKIDEEQPDEGTALIPPHGKLLPRDEQLRDDFEWGNTALITLTKPKRGHRFQSIEEISLAEDEMTDDLTVMEGQNGDKAEDKRFTVESLGNMKLNGNVLTAKMGSGQNKIVKDLSFASESLARNFMDEILQLKEKKIEMYEREGFQLSARPGLLEGHDPEEELSFLVEIVSAINLPIADRDSTDPLVVVWHGDSRIHKTKYMSKDLNPIWALNTGSLFLFRTTYGEFMKESSYGLRFEVQDFDASSKNDEVAALSLTHDEVLQSTGKRIEYPLSVMLKDYRNTSRHNSTKPKLTLRIRRAEHQDIWFMQEFLANSKKKGVCTDEAYVPPRHRPGQFLRGDRKKGANGEVLCRVKPTPDPDRAETTKWMDEEQIELESQLPSRGWIEAGSGPMAKIYFEIIGCDSLDNLDAMAGDKSDPYCMIVYEDSMVCTDVINDCLSPRWLPWTQRAFVLNMSHPSSQIFVGVFDYDKVTGGVGSHDPIGRVAIDLTHLVPDTEYNLSYNIHKSTFKDDRTPSGKIHVRFRIEMADGVKRKSFIKRSIRRPPWNYINVTKSVFFKGAFYTVNGEEDLSEVNLKTIKRFRSELMYRQVVLSEYFYQGFKTVVFWRGHYPVNLGCIHFKLPIHSLVTFIACINVVENANLLPSFVFFFLGWMLLANNEYRQRHPSPWQRPLSYGQIWAAVFFGDPSPATIEDTNGELAALTKSYEDNENKRIRQKLSKNKKKMEEKEKELSEEPEKEGGEEEGEEEEGPVEDNASEYKGKVTSISSNTHRVRFNPLRPVLLPVQNILSRLVFGNRVFRSIFMWDECYYAFLLTNLMFFIAFLCLWAPWIVLLHWLLRAIVWIGLGPWQKITDIVYVRKLEADGPNWAKAFHTRRTADAHHILHELRMIRYRITRAKKFLVKQEDAMKTKAMRNFLFGKLSVGLPRFKSYRFFDWPLPDSSAKPVMAGPDEVKIVVKKRGQQLVGDMIPDLSGINIPHDVY